MVTGMVMAEVSLDGGPVEAGPKKHARPFKDFAPFGQSAVARYPHGGVLPAALHRALGPRPYPIFLSSQAKLPPPREVMP